MEQAEILRQLKAAGNFFDLSEVRTFQGYREDKSGGVQTVTIRIFDGGPDATIRYHIIAEDEQGRRGSGNNADQLDLTIALVHWGELDKDPTPPTG